MPWQRRMNRPQKGGKNDTLNHRLLYWLSSRDSGNGLGGSAVLATQVLKSVGVMTMKFYRVIGQMTWTHSCDCGYCELPTRQPVNVSIVIPGPNEYDEFGDKSDIEDAALNEQYRAMGLFDRTDSLSWNSSQEVQIREAYPDEVLAAMGAPRLPGFEEVL